MKYPKFTGFEPCAQIGGDWFYPDDASVAKHINPVVRAVCNTCPIRVECAEWAIHHEAFGMWGGLTPNQRRLIRAERGISLVQPDSILFPSLEEEAS